MPPEHPQTPPSPDAPLIENLAALEHEQWAHWMRYMTANMTPENMARWKRQMDTPYAELTEKEKESDREWARKAVGVLLEYLQDEMVRKQKKYEAHLTSFELVASNTRDQRCDVELLVPILMLPALQEEEGDVRAKRSTPDGVLNLGGEWPAYFWISGPVQGGFVEVTCSAYDATAAAVYEHLQKLPNRSTLPVSLARDIDRKTIPDHLPLLR